MSCAKTRTAAPEKKWPVAGVVLESRAKADLRAQGSDVWLPAPCASVVLDGDTLRNQNGGGLIVSLSEGGSMRAGEASDLLLRRGTGGMTEVVLNRGEVWLEGGGREGFTVITPAATVRAKESGPGERECSFSVLAQPAGPTTVTVVKGAGKVECGGGVADAPQGTVVTCKPGQAPEDPVAGVPAAPHGGYSFFVGLQTTPYFRNAGTRDRMEDEARSRLSVEPDDAWSFVSLGRVFCDAGNSSEARDAFSKALELKQGFSQAHAGLGMLALKEGHWLEAREEYEQARLADRSSLDALLGCSNSALGMGDLPEAVKWYKEALETDPESHLSLTGLAIANLLEGDPGVAGDNLRQALAARPGHVPALLVSSIVASLKGNVSGSLASLKRAADAAPDDAGARAALACAYARTGASEQATAAFRQLSESEDPRRALEGLQGLGCVKYSRGEVADAIDDWTAAREISGEDPSVLQDLAQGRMLSDDTASASAILAETVARDPADWWGRVLLARACLVNGDSAQALEHARVASELAPSEWSAHLVYGIALEACGFPEDAARELEKAMALRPEGELTAFYHVLLAEGLVKLDRKEEALAEYERAQRAAPDDGIYHRMAAELLFAMGRRSDALAEYREAVKLSPDDVLSRVLLAEVLFDTGKKDEAIEMLQRAVSGNPNDARARIFLGRYLVEDGDVEGALFQLDAVTRSTGASPELLAEALVISGNARDRKEDYAGALNEYNRAVAADASRGDAWYYMAADLEKLGRPAEAKAAYEKAAQLCTSRPEWKKFAEESGAKLNAL